MAIVANSPEHSWKNHNVGCHSQSEGPHFLFPYLQCFPEFLQYDPKTIYQYNVI